MIVLKGQRNYTCLLRYHSCNHSYKAPDLYKHSHHLQNCYRTEQYFSVGEPCEVLFHLQAK